MWYIIKGIKTRATELKGLTNNVCMYICGDDKVRDLAIWWKELGYDSITINPMSSELMDDINSQFIKCEIAEISNRLSA